MRSTGIELATLMAHWRASGSGEGQSGSLYHQTPTSRQGYASISQPEPQRPLTVDSSSHTIFSSMARHDEQRPAQEIVEEIDQLRSMLQQERTARHAAEQQAASTKAESEAAANWSAAVSHENQLLHQHQQLLEQELAAPDRCPISSNNVADTAQFGIMQSRRLEMLQAELSSCRAECTTLGQQLAATVASQAVAQRELRAVASARHEEAVSRNAIQRELAQAMAGLAVHRQRGEEVEDLLRQQMQATQQVADEAWAAEQRSMHQLQQLQEERDAGKARLEQVEAQLQQANLDTCLHQQRMGDLRAQLQQQRTAAMSADGAAQALQRALVDTQGDLRDQVAQVEALQQQLRQVSLVVEQSAARGAVLQRQLVIAQQEGQDMGVAAAAATADAAFLQAQLGEASPQLYGLSLHVQQKPFGSPSSLSEAQLCSAAALPTLTPPVKQHAPALGGLTSPTALGSPRNSSRRGSSQGSNTGRQQRSASMMAQVALTPPYSFPLLSKQQRRRQLSAPNEDEELDGLSLSSTPSSCSDVPEEDIEAQRGNDVLQPLDNTPKKKPLNLMVKLSKVPKSHARSMHPQPEELSSPECLHAQQSPEKLLLMR